jgi:DNA-directed RNA polymerase beta' subunit
MGHINLAKPVFHPLYLSTIMAKMLTMVCFRCSRVLVNLDKTDKHGNLDAKHQARINSIKSKIPKARFSLVKLLVDEEKKSGKCPYCQASLPSKIQKHPVLLSKLRVFYEVKAERDPKSEKDKDAKPEKGKKEVERLVNPEIVLSILKGIPNEDISLMGFDPELSRPEWMIWTVLPFPPITVRPPTKLDIGRYGDDDLTIKLNEISKTNNNIKCQLQKLSDDKDNCPLTSKADIDYLWEMLQYHVATYIDNESNKKTSVHRSGRPLKALVQRIKTKEGRVRWNLMGKRVNDSGRTVITPDNNINLDEIGIPLKIANNLVKPESVTPFNINRLQKLVYNGLDQYPGAKYVVQKGSRFKKPLKVMDSKKRSQIKLAIGDVVYRNLLDGDWVLVNRQPSLHRMSMMAHKVVILKGETFRLNVQSVTPYNADFDGDEMNIHVPQSLESQNEMARLSHLATQIVSPKNSLPVMGLVQDGLLGLYIFGKHGFLSVKNTMRMLNDLNITNIHPYTSGGSNGHLYTHSRDIINQTLPKITVVNSKDRSVKNDTLKFGYLDQNQTIGPELLKNGQTGVFHNAWSDYGPKTAKDLFDNLARIATNWLMVSGFSIGILDCIPNDYIKNRIHSIVSIYDRATQYLVDFEQLRLLPTFDSFGDTEFNSHLDRLIALIKNKGYTYSTKSEVEDLLSKIYYPIVARRLLLEFRRVDNDKFVYPSHKEEIIDQNIKMVLEYWTDPEKGYVCNNIYKFEMDPTTSYKPRYEKLLSLVEDNADRQKRIEELVKVDKLGITDEEEDRLNELEAFCAFVQTLIHITPGANMSDRLEEKLYELTQKSTDIVNKIISDNVGFYEYRGLDRDYFNYRGNSFKMMRVAGSKGKTDNIGQIAGLLGQQDLEGKRQGNFFYRRSLPHYPKDSIEPRARGYVHNSFLDGLTMLEYFSHAQAGRLNQIDKTIKSVTPDTDIILLENGKILQLTIGEWVDKKLEIHQDKVIHQIDQEMEILKLKDDKVSIPTCDADGNVSWGEITAITRHDPGQKLYEVKTLGGRRVIVTESKSLLIWNKDVQKFLHTSTPEVKVGDYMPVTTNLPDSSEYLGCIDMEEYFPKKKYIYGSEFLQARKMYNEVKTQSVNIQKWWDEHNGREFTLPYTKLSRFTRTLERSDLSNIEEGFLYPYHARRTGKLPAKFELNHSNGQFIGLFLAEGNVDIKSGYVQITNNETNILEFTQSWFEKMQISCSQKTKVNKLEKETTCIRGHSTLLARFLTALVGHGAANKLVPSESILAPTEFLQGLIGGYISGDGTITENSIVVGSASERLINGINILCSRLGIFGKITKTIIKPGNLDTPNPLPRHCLSIRAQWASLFAREIKLVDSNKQRRLVDMKPAIKHVRFPVQHDVVLDRIVEINEVDVKLYPKVYDLTIPSTLNFGLANGLHVVDTAETGYLQRKLIKMMEGLTVHYDGTVRNSSKNVIQKLYGGDAIDPQQLENVRLDFSNLRERFYLEKLDDLSPYLKPSVIQVINARSDTLVKINAQYKTIQDDVRLINEFYSHLNIFGETLRQEISDTTVQSKCKKKAGSNDLYAFLPVNFERLVHNNYYRFQRDKLEGDKHLLSDLDPLYVIEKTDKMLERMEASMVLNAKEHLLLFSFAMRSSLSVKQLIRDLHFSKQAFDTLLEDIYLKYCRSLVSPGESIGIISAQSIGEPLTQMTLNKFHAAGVGKARSKLQTGVPRLGELLGLTQKSKMKTPSMEMKVSEYYILLKDKQKAHFDIGVINQMKAFEFKSIVESSEICYDPGHHRPGKHITDHHENYYVMDNIPDAKKIDTKELPWVIHFKLKIHKKREMRSDAIFNAIDGLIRK